MTYRNPKLNPQVGDHFLAHIQKQTNPAIDFEEIWHVVALEGDQLTFKVEGQEEIEVMNSRTFLELLRTSSATYVVSEGE